MIQLQAHRNGTLSTPKMKIVGIIILKNQGNEPRLSTNPSIVCDYLGYSSIFTLSPHTPTQTDQFLCVFAP